MNEKDRFVLTLLSKSASGSSLLYEHFGNNVQYLQNLLNRELISVVNKDGMSFINITERGRQEVFIDSI